MKLFLMPLAVAMMACGGADGADVTPAEEGDVAIQLVATAPVHRGTNSFTLSTADDATNVDVKVWMPSMGHGAPSDSRIVRVAGESGSNYRIEDVVFSMPGTWELKVNVTCPSRAGSRAFRFEVP